jgi:hypothetical protein
MLPFSTLSAHVRMTANQIFSGNFAARDFKTHSSHTFPNSPPELMSESPGILLVEFW